MSLTVVHASGSPRDLGRAQGEGSAEGIAASLRFYDELGPDVRALGGDATPYIDAARAALPDLVDELEGLAEGAGVTFEEISFLNCMEEVWNFEACTTMIHGRFFLHAEQWYAGHDDVTVVFAAPDGGPGFVSPTSICLHEVGPHASGTVFGVACDLSNGRMIVSDGPPCGGQWESFEIPDFAPEVPSVV